MNNVSGLTRDTWLVVSRMLPLNDFNTFRLTCKKFRDWTKFDALVRRLTKNSKRCPEWLPESKIRCPMPFPCPSHDLNIELFKAATGRSLSDFKRDGHCWWR